MKKMINKVILTVSILCMTVFLAGCTETASAPAEKPEEAAQAPAADEEVQEDELGIPEEEAEETVDEETEEVPAETEEKSEVVVLAAASLTDVCTEIEQIYEEAHPQTDLLFSFGGSGALQAQIEEGAKADLFFSADTKQMDALNEENLIESDSITELLENKLVLVVPKGSELGLSSFEDAASDKVKMIGIGEPESVPAGRYAMEVYDYLKLTDDITAKANYGADVRTVLSWVEEGVVDCGVVYKTDAFTTDKVEIAAEAPEGSLRKVIYPAGIVNTGENRDAAADFLDYLKSDEAMDLFVSYGFEKAK